MNLFGWQGLVGGLGKWGGFENLKMRGLENGV
jgi:hypothetical protein